ncbi:U11/U12 small nuclear ribonucleoprotein 31 kDa protein [Forsythia ovata]|uniref:U11/U12 small nuclear ribonucleoprotein 31 kDa protein n=1 Tax=Forsythia ovata TaxID=205694 RepID=A0ABD1VN36_9LAMI
MSQKRNYSDDEEDETFYYCYTSRTSATSALPSSSSVVKPSRGGRGSDGLAPSKSMVYISNLDYNLTNSNFFTIFSTFSKVAKATVLKDCATHQSQGAVKGIDKKVLNGRTLSASIAADNGCASEFFTKKVYKDKSRCYECGEEGHLSYECSKNFLGVRELSKKRRGPGGGTGGKNYDWDDEGDEGVFETENWASVVDGEGAEERLLRSERKMEKVKKEKREKKKGYFSDESDEEE